MPTRLEAAQVVGGRFRLLREVGRGAAGAVWQVRNVTTDRDFALKVLHADRAQDAAAVRRFLNEARAAGRLRHPNVVEVYDTGELDDGTPYQVMELLEGRSLGARLREGRPLPIDVAVRVARDIAKGLAAAHAAGIVHRDVKPENVFLCPGEPFDVARLVDFGVSKLEDAAGDPLATREGALLGSPAYMSPEQIASAADADARADIWAVGVVLYRCLAGRVPFPQRGLRDLAFAITTSDHPPLDVARPGISPALRAVVDRCLAKSPEGRFASAHELAAALDAVLSGASEATASTDVPPARPRRTRARARTIAVAGCALLSDLPLTTLHLLRGPSDALARERAAAASSSAPSPARSPELPAPVASPKPTVDIGAAEPSQDRAARRSGTTPSTVAKPRGATPRPHASRPSHEGVTDPGF